MKQEPTELKRLYWSEDKEQITHILSRVNIKYLCSLLRKAKYIQRHKLYDPIDEDIDYYDKVDFQKENELSYVSSKVMCKYDGCIFEVSLKTIKEEMKRREENGEVSYDDIYSWKIRRWVWTPFIKKIIKLKSRNEGNKEKSKGKNTGKTIKNKRNEVTMY